ncbi:putative ABC-type nitrate/sulfonate/bicarbonate substrate-binding protein [Pontimonas salivibrio]|uniref:Putative ABC-type nitrate/sulfonate/bicarbonate substrate-binding protein n=1 Tax=Pontimonas salivibrio TaxID=1159327 RepID=A0A2L2BQ83_9MICO|nr:putative ABC-type nitrate/sulfonate/bicarbonate substrate-binding protein [Pontimonas salivibrio]
MAQSFPRIKIGQFSESPVLAVARGLGLDSRYGLSWVTDRVASSPGQFESLRNGEYDLVVTSPDNVLLYATTDANPLKEKINLRLLRPIDRGLGLALYTSRDIEHPTDFIGCTLGVDVMSSGFALLLLRMLEELGVEDSSISFKPVGATPKRLVAITEGDISGSILNAETAVAAEAAGLKKWSSSVDVSDHYLGTVLCQMAGPVSDSTRAFLDMWEEATGIILASAPESLVEVFSESAPALATKAYVDLLQSSDFGCIAGEEITIDALTVLADIRAAAHAYTPNEQQIKDLLDSSR